MFAGDKRFWALLGIVCAVGCGGGTSKPLEKTVTVEPGKFEIEADAIELAVGEEGTADVQLHRGEGFDEKVEFTFTPSAGLNANPKTYTPAEDENGATSTLIAGKPGEYTVDIAAKAASGDEKKISVKVTVKPAEK